MKFWEALAVSCTGLSLILFSLRFALWLKGRQKHSKACDADFLSDHLRLTISNQLIGVTKTEEEIAQWGGTSWPHDFDGN